MSKRMLINYFLLILIIIFTWIGLKYPITEDQKINRSAITTLKPQQVKDIKIETADETILLQKQGTSWFVLKPINWYASNIAAERLTTLAAAEPQSKLPVAQIDLSTLGLKIPKAVVTLNNNSIYFGDSNRIGNRRYLMVEPNVYLVSDLYYAFISQGLTGLVDNRLLPSQMELQQLEFPTFKITRDASGWTSNGEDKTKQAATRLVTNWQQKQATVKPYDKTLTPLNKVKTTLQDGSKIEFFILSIEPEIVIARADLNIQYHFPDHQYYELLSIDQPSE